MRHAPSLVALLAIACASPTPGAGDGGSDGGEAPTVTIEFADACAPFTACASDVHGTWTLEHVCIERGRLWPTVKTFCSTATLSGLSGTTSGTLSSSVTELRRDVSTSLSGTITLPAACLTHGADCSYLRDSLVAMLHATVSCAGSESCECTVSDVRVTHASAPITVTGQAFTTNPGTSSERTFDVCATGSTLTFRETASPDADPAIYTLAR
jgi:hypothetical protein